MAKELSPAGQKIFLTVFCSIFIAVGLAFWIPNFLMPVLEWSARRTWKETPCTVVQSPKGMGDAFDSGLVYRYEFDGRTMESADPGSMAWFSPDARRLWELQPGATLVCYVDPRPPHKAVLKRDFDPETFIWCAPLMFVILPGFAMVAGWINIGRKKTQEPVPDNAAVLGQRRARGCVFVLQFSFLLFFGGIVAFLVLTPGFRESMVLRLVYLVPVAFITLLILKGLLRSLFRTPAPEIVLVITPAEAVPGRMLEVRWEAKGVSDRAKGFQIRLEGREGIHVGRSVQEAVFDWIEVAKGGPKDLRRGYSKITLPETTMPSLTHGTHRIRWAFRVSGEIPGIDPVEGEEFAFEIRPAKEKTS